jgi:DNA-binding SARP family transcriptional activator
MGGFYSNPLNCAAKTSTWLCHHQAAFCAYNSHTVNHLRLLGPPQFQTPSRTLAPDRRTAGVLAYLALEGKAHKYRLAGWLWPDSGEESAKNNMRQLLRRLRLGAGEVVKGEDHIELVSDVEVDVRQLSYLETPSLERLRHNAELLEGFEYDDAPDFEEWLLEAKEELLQLRVRSLSSEAERLEKAGNFKGAMEYAQVWVQLEPLSEEAQRQVIRLHYLLGDRGAALSAFENFKQLLQRELGVTPLPKTLDRPGHYSLHGGAARRGPSAVARGAGHG